MFGRAHWSYTYFGTVNFYATCISTIKWVKNYKTNIFFYTFFGSAYNLLLDFPISIGIGQQSVPGEAENVTRIKKSC